MYKRTTASEVLSLQQAGWQAHALPVEDDRSRVRKQMSCRARKAESKAEKSAAPVVGSSMKMMEGLATSSTAMVRRLRCSTLRPVLPGMPTSEFAQRLQLHQLPPVCVQKSHHL